MPQLVISEMPADRYQPRRVAIWVGA